MPRSRSKPAQPPHRSRTAIAYAIMQQALEAGRAAGHTPQDIHRAITAAYPWGNRQPSKWPYKAWLIARRQFYERHGLPGLRAVKGIAQSEEP
ncbi:Uncharacterised protein [Bordetella ansorpii]|uniref:Uncharacterized protein n=1 Tax=Bordetella ansorpii TaxID=288768 RepID=A0A157QLT7_9BORD|nr:hypothetical protein [Bordetella ansorpii]SAI46608.1 Uncharacterised protein [Bordetella ansorpii]